MGKVIKFGIIHGGKSRKVDDQTLNLFEDGLGKPKSGLEDNLDLKPKPQKYILQNLLDCYGLNATNLRSFASTPNYSPQIMRDNFYFLEKALVGIWNTEFLNDEFGFSHDMLTTLHPAEAIAGYHKIGHLKMDGDGGLEYLKSLKPDKVDEPDKIGEFFKRAIDESLQYYHGFRVFYNKYPKLHETPVEDRVGQLEDESKERFLRSVRIPYRNIHMARKTFPKALESRLPTEPNFDGIDHYIQAISEVMREVYRHNTRRVD